VKLIIIVCASLILSGCADHPDGWEFQTYVETGTGVEQLLEKEKALKASGYKRVWITEVDFGRAILIRATRTEGGDTK